MNKCLNLLLENYFVRVNIKSWNLHLELKLLS